MTLSKDVCFDCGARLIYCEDCVQFECPECRSVVVFMANICETCGGDPCICNLSGLVGLSPFIV